MWKRAVETTAVGWIEKGATSTELKIQGGGKKETPAPKRGGGVFEGSK